MLAALHFVTALRVYAAGSGHDMFSLPQTAAEVIAERFSRTPRPDGHIEQNPDYPG